MVILCLSICGRHIKGGRVASFKACYTGRHIKGHLTKLIKENTRRRHLKRHIKGHIKGRIKGHIKE